MVMLTSYNQACLPEFQNLLRQRKLALEKQIPFLARWAKTYLAFLGQSPDASVPFDIGLEHFLKHTSIQEKIQPWQIAQAETAVRLYNRYFGTKEEIRPVAPATAMAVEEKIRERMRLRHYSFSTERSYLDWYSRFHKYVSSVRGKSVPSEWTSEDVSDFLSRLAVVDRVSASTQNQAFNGLLFLFRDVLGRSLDDIRKTVRAKRGVRLPVVLSRGEVRAVFSSMTGGNRLILELLYGTGMRLMELARLRVQDLDFDRGTLYIRGGKGDKDRTTLLPKSVRDPLQKHLLEVKGLHEEDLAKGHGEVFLPEGLDRKYPHAGKEWKWQYVFPSDRLSVDPRSGKVRRHHLSDSAIQQTMARAVVKAGLTKHATVHTLRHSFATHLLMKGVNIREVQELLGHKSVETTMIYTHVLRDMANAPSSPLDDLLTDPEGNTTSRELAPTISH
jgi:integron integrase